MVLLMLSNISQQNLPFGAITTNVHSLTHASMHIPHMPFQLPYLHERPPFQLRNSPLHRQHLSNRSQLTPPTVPDPYTNRTRHHTPPAHPPSLLATAPQHYKTATTTLPSRYPTSPNPYRSQGTIALHASPQQRKTCRALLLRKPTAHRRHTCLVRRGNCATEAGKRRTGLRADRVRGRGGAIGIP
jgi:hypothetical protein